MPVAQPGGLMSGFIILHLVSNSVERADDGTSRRGAAGRFTGQVDAVADYCPGAADQSVNNSRLADKLLSLTGRGQRHVTHLGLLKYPETVKARDFEFCPMVGH